MSLPTPPGAWFGLEVPAPMEADLAVFGVPFDAAVFFRRGTAAGPDRIRALSAMLPPTSESGISLRGRSIRDLGDVSPPAELSAPIGEWPVGHEPAVRSFHQELTQRFDAASEIGIPLAIGGDHSISVPLISRAVQRTDGPCGLIWLDAHPDLCHTYSGSCYSHACVLRRVLETSGLLPDLVVMLGLRSFETEELEYIDRNRLIYHTARALSGRPPCDVAIEVNTLFSQLPVYLSIDIDVFDPAFAPGTGIPDAGGLSSRWVLDFLANFRPARLLGVDIVEVAPSLDAPSDPTSLLALKLILELLDTMPRRRS